MNAFRNQTLGARMALGTWIKTWFGGNTEQARRPERRRVQLGLEGLEERRVMTVSAVPTGTILTQIAAQEIAPQVASQIVHGLAAYGTQNSAAVVQIAFSSTNLGNLLKLDGIGYASVNQDLAHDTDIDVANIFQTLLASSRAGSSATTTPTLSGSQTTSNPFVQLTLQNVNSFYGTEQFGTWLQNGPGGINQLTSEILASPRAERRKRLFHRHQPGWHHRRQTERTLGPGDRQPGLERRLDPAQ
jgi:hypothetical protein